MKNVLIISSIALIASVAQAGNGSGTMGVAANMISKIDFRNEAIIRFDTINLDRSVSLQAITGINDNESSFETIAIPAKLISPALREEIKTSAKNGSWRAIPVEQLTVLLGVESGKN